MWPFSKQGAKDSMDAESHYNSFLEFHDQGKLDLAWEEIQKACSANPRYAGSFGYLGQTFEGRGDKQKAVAAYNEFLKYAAFPENKGRFEEVLVNFKSRLAVLEGKSTSAPSGTSEEDNLSRWKNSGGPKQWVEKHGYSWAHQDWLNLLEELRRSPYWPMNPDKIGAALEEIKRKNEALIKDKPAMIGSAKVILAINSAAISRLAAQGLEIQDVLGLILTEGSSSSEIVTVSASSVRLSPTVKQWCLNTHVYRDSRGGIVVTDREVDGNTAQTESLSHIGTVDPQNYMAALSIKFNLRGKDIFV
jgi:tetratricopeptide (TPR) repeat protein